MFLLVGVYISLLGCDRLVSRYLFTGCIVYSVLCIGCARMVEMEITKEFFDGDKVVDTEKGTRLMRCQNKECNKLIEWRPRRKWCLDCSKKRHKQDQINYAKKKQHLLKKHKTTVVCKCPLCGELHKVRMDWTGKGMPRKYCRRCL